MFDTGESHIDLTQLTVTWIFEGGHIVADFSQGEITHWHGVKLFKDGLHNGNASLLIHSVTKDDEGYYRCQVKYSSETAFQQMNLHIQGSGLHVSVSPLKTRVRVGSNVLLSCMFDTGESHIDLTQLTVTWIFEGGHIVADFNQGEIAHWHGVKLFKDGLHNGNASLLIHSVTKDDEGYYRCQVKYSSESAFQQMNVHIQDPEADSTEIPVLRTTSMTEQEGNQVTQVIPVTDVYEVESMTAVKMSSVTQSKEVVLKSTDTAKETQPMALLKREHSIILGCLVVIVIIAASVLIYFCSRKRQKDKTAESDADL
ncbi:uncharacterized protein LOC122813991 [Protopterus annectens]|uniref:uncharacterized protein LOC122813991 n=1 Tax=Protopterus annectens TaxID=7888 RepID=UPI001CF98E0C|nr:uncharacterized protein LOC122813991 [Protopterus annectens]